MIKQEIPSPIDLRLMSDAQEWANTALYKRPSRTEFFSEFIKTISNSNYPIKNILELGSGPGFLAECLLNHLTDIHYTAMDFSAAMHQLASERLGKLSSRVEWIERSFKDEQWNKNLGIFDCVVTMQAVHELRHKQYASKLHCQVRQILRPCGFYLVCDHYYGSGGMQNDQLYMSISEQRDALHKSGFNHVVQLMKKESLVLHYAAVV